MFRFVVVVVVSLCLIPGFALAQRTSGAPASAPALPSIALPLPQIALPLPAIGVPLSPLGFPAASDSPRRGDPPGSGSPHGPRRNNGRFRGAPTVVYFAAPYQPAYEPAPQPPTPGLNVRPPEPSPAPPTGRLRLEVEPTNDLQVFVDGVFVGALDDLGPELDLPAGVRRIELHAPGREPLKVSVNIADGRTITYRGRLQAAQTAPAEAPAREPQVPAAQPTPPRQSQTFYVIPGCYLGNVPPNDIKLPAGCDLSRTTTFKP